MAGRVGVAVAFEVVVAVDVAVQFSVERAVTATPEADKVRRLSEAQRSVASLAALRFSGARSSGSPFLASFFGEAKKEVARRGEYLAWS